MKTFENKKIALVLDAFITSTSPDKKAIANKLEISISRVNQIIKTYIKE